MKKDKIYLDNKIKLDMENLDKRVSKIDKNYIYELALVNNIDLLLHKLDNKELLLLLKNEIERKIKEE